ncbi:hypothetical protein FY034_17255 (plasmid) [Trichlorobacter lovleyi]|uniref:hypothetical protein n=1 Tax=Trichlorobacter lovleyi TaxID=313985 RepID=UPI00224073AC|nr:hypothetical protein [Trichlorobacter lovleyi]QOX80771.1 hypothetical protein FY034_17255 [Trichlorobacter lovleyi]
MDNESGSLNSIKARVDALRKGSIDEASAGGVAQKDIDLQKKFAVDSAAPIEEGIITMARTGELVEPEEPANDGVDSEVESELDRQYNILHPDQADLATDNGENSTTPPMSKKTKMMIAGGVAALGLLAYGATTMVSAVNGKKQETVSLSLQSAKGVPPLLVAAQPRISSASGPQQAVFVKISSVQKQQAVSVTPNQAPLAQTQMPKTPQLTLAAQDKPLTKMQSAQMRAVPQLAIQQPQPPEQKAIAQPQPPAEQPKKIEEPKKLETPKKPVVAKKHKVVTKKRIKHDEDTLPQRTTLAKKNGSDEVLAILERARNSQ